MITTLHSNMVKYYISTIHSIRIKHYTLHLNIVKYNNLHYTFKYSTILLLPPYILILDNN